MILIPAIDLKDGKCVRLRQGRMHEVTLFSDDPVATAGRWVDAGCKRLHIIDLDGAISARLVNTSIINRIVMTFPDISIQVGGGIRDKDAIEVYLDAGVQFVILGSKAVTAPHFVTDSCVQFPGHIIVGLDAEDGKVAIDGWSKLSHHNLIDLAQHFEQDRVSSIIYTDIRRDGMMTGVNVDASVTLARSVTIPIIASGGVSGMDDIRALLEVADEGIAGVILGRSLYEGTLDLGEAQRLVDEYSAP